MKKILFFIVLIFATLINTSCSKFDHPAKAKRIGCGQVQQQNNIHFVEIDGIRYSLSELYSNRCKLKEKTKPIEGSIVTCFTLYNAEKFEFIAGDVSEEYLEEYFSTNDSFVIIITVIATISVALILFIGDDHPKRNFY
jgi:hypothetical protein